MISIIVPTYNREKLIANTINSVLAQTNGDWELIVVDDGSTDGTDRVVEGFLADSRIKYIKKQNSGATHTRNVGATHATGEFITFLDSDDEAYPHWIESINKLIDAETGFVCTGAIKKMPDGQSIEELPWDSRYYGEKLKLKFTCGSFIIRRSVFEAVGGYDVSLKSNQHTDLGYRLLHYLKDKPLKKKHTDECLIQINIHNGARIRTNWKQVSEGSIQFINKHYDFLVQSDNHYHISNIYSVIAFSNYKLKDRSGSLKYLLKSIRHNPSNVKNYFKLIKYGVL